MKAKFITGSSRFAFTILVLCFALQGFVGVAVSKPRANGPIIVSVGQPGSRALWSVSASGTFRHRITHGFDDSAPAVSPDGRYIVFVRHSESNGDQLVTARVSGKGSRRLTQGFGQNFDPVFSPDGRTIAFTLDSAVATMTRSGGNLTSLTTPFGPGGDPAYTPDGSQIVFSSTKTGNFELFSMAADGTDFTQLTSDSGSNFGPAVSPNGVKIAFASNRTGTSQIFTMNPDGSAVRQLTHGPASSQPTYSPDGQSICFVRKRKLYTMGTAGKHVRLIWGRGPVDTPTWSHAADPRRG